MKKRPLVVSIFWLTVILGVFYPIILFIRVWVNYSAIHWLELKPHIPPTDISWFAWFLLLLGFNNYAAAKALFSWLLGVLPAAFALWHFRTIELLHRSLYADDMPPNLIPTYEQTPSLADPADRSPPPEIPLNHLRLIAYHSYRIWKWFWGIIANPTFGEFFRVVLVKLPDPWNSWILNPIWDQVRRFLSWIIGIIGEILRGVSVKLPDSWIRGNLYRIWGCFRGFLTSITGAVLRVVLVALTLSPAILLFVIWLLWPLIFQSWTSILTHINLNLSPTMLFMLFCFLIVFFPHFFDFLCLLLNTEKIFKRAQIYVELCHLLESSGKKEEIRAAMEKQVRKHEESQSLHSINRESLFEVFNAQEKIENYFRVQQELPEFNKTDCRRFFWNHVVKGMPLPPDDNPNPIKRLKPKFLCPVNVKSGFLSPTYLVSGLLSEFDENWQLIVRNYGLDMAWKEDPLLQGNTYTHKFKLLELRKLQSFIWMCWIQWGPSIPIHGSDNWKSGPIGLQYGYGDENNSLPLFLINKNKRLIEWTELTSQYQNWQKPEKDPDPPSQRAIVIPTSLTANLAWVRLDENVCKPQKKNEPFLALKANLDTVSDTPNIHRNWHESSMYSAYVWVIFAVCVKVKSQTQQSTENGAFPALLFPWNESATDNQRKEQAWRGLIPFFQHGNIAEPTVYESIKKELAYKTLHTLKEYLEPEVCFKDGRVLEISFVCAFDENGDGSTRPLALNSGSTIRQYMDSVLKTTYSRAGWKARLHLKEDAVPEITSCRMPKIVEQYFQSIRAYSIEPDDLLDDRCFRDLRTPEGESTDEKNLRKNIISSAKNIFSNNYLFKDNSSQVEAFWERLSEESLNMEPKTYLLVFGKNLDRDSEFKVYGCLGIEWYPSIECGRFTHLAVDPLFRKQGIGRELIWRGSVVLRDSAEAAGKSLKGIFTWIKGSDEAATESSENPGDTLIRLGAKPIQSDNLTYTLDPKNGLTDTSKFYSFEPDFVDIKAENKISILNELIGKILSK
jgi:GNAT superfamily N-acetyltransferase